MADFFLNISPSVVIGSHVLSRVGHIVQRCAGEQAKRFMLVSDPTLKDTGMEEAVLQALKKNEIELILFSDMSVSDSATIANAISLARGAKVQGVISLGSANAAAIGRVVAALYSEQADIYEYIEGKQPLSKPLPFIEVPSIYADPFMFMHKTLIADSKSKRLSLIKIQDTVCSAVIVDPNVYAHMPANTQAAMLFEAAAIAFEGYISTKASFLSDAILREGFKLVFSALDNTQGQATGDSKEIPAQGGCIASLGAAISSPGVVTAVATACSARYGVSSAVVSAVLFPFLVEDAFRSSVEKARNLAKIITPSVDVANTWTASDSNLVVEEIRKRLSATGLPVRLKDAGLEIVQLADVVEDACKMDFLSYAPRSMTSDELFTFIKQAF